MLQRARRLSRKRNTSVSLYLGGSIVCVFGLMAVISLLWTPYDPTAVNIPDAYLPPGQGGHLLGTDAFGRDVVSLIMAGAQTSLVVSGLATLSAVVPGVLIGLWTANARQGVRNGVSRLVDIGIGMPGILIALVLAAVIGPGVTAAVIAIVVWFIPVVVRLVIGPARQVLALEYVEAATAYGRSRAYILFRHVLPNISSIIIVQASVTFALGILIEAALAYLGIGAQPPTPSWGRSLTEAQGFIATSPHMIIFPGVAIMLVVLGFNLLGDGLRSLLDPRQQSGRGFL